MVKGALWLAATLLPQWQWHARTETCTETVS